MALPLNPNINDTYVIGSKTYRWDGNAWTRSNLAEVESVLLPYALDTDLTTSNVVETANLYFTNTRAVYALTAGAGITIASNGRITSTVTGGGGGGGNVDSVNGLTGAVVLTTANVFEDGNLYFTNTRVYANVLLLDYSTNTYVNDRLLTKANVYDLTTANIVENGNLYFTNTRAISALTSGSGISIASNGRITSTATGGGNVDSVNGLTGAVVLTTANVFEDGNLYFTNNRVYSNIIALDYSTNTYVNTRLETKANVTDLTTANLIEDGNLYYTDSRVYDNVSLIGYVLTSTFDACLSAKANTVDLSTAIVFEDGNLYYTDDRVYTNVLLLDYSTNTYVNERLVTKANVTDLTTSNIIEGSNLYFTNARVYSNVIALDYSTNTYVNSRLNTKANIGDLTTANVYEDGNLYFTNTRVYANVIALDYSTNTYVNERLLSKANINDLNTSNIVEGSNLYFTNTRVLSYLQNIEGNVLPALDLTYNLGSSTRRWKDLYLSGNTVYLGNALIQSTNESVQLPPGSIITGQTTDDLNEGNINLFFTNTRVRNAITNGVGVAYNPANGQISIGQEVATSSSVTFKDLLVTGNVTFAGNAAVINTTSLSVTDNMIYLNESKAELISNVIGDGANVTYYLVDNHTASIGNMLRVTGVDPSSFNTSYVPIIALTANSLTITSNVVSSYVSGGNAFIKAAVNPDLGFSGGYNDGTYHHAGLFRDATDGYWKFFENYSPEPDSNVFIDTSHPSFSLANVSAKAFYGNIGGGTANSLLLQTAPDTTSFLTSPALDYTYLRYDTANGITWGTLYESSSVVYLANSIALDPSYGTYNSGNVLSIRTVGDYNLDANNYYSINETATTPGYIAYIDFVDVQNFNRILINLFYTQNSTHVIYVDLKNKNTLQWDSFGTYNGLGTYYQFALSVIDPTQYIQAGNLVELRLYHQSPGNTSHNHRIDYVALELSTQGPQGPKGTTGATGATGAGVATGGSAGQLLIKANSTDYATYWGDPTTSNISEGSNLYFTNTRAISALTGGTGIVINSNGLVVSTVSSSNPYGDDNVYSNVNLIGFASNTYVETRLLTKANVSDLTTSNIIEGSNLYFTNARVYSNVIDLGYSTNTYVNSRLLSKANVTDLTTANVEEVGNLYFTNARVYSNVIALDYSTNAYVNTRLLTKANVADLNTSNIVEGSNLYFTNTRSIYALTSGSGISIASNGLITSTVTGGGGGSGTVTDVFGQTVSVSNAQLACATITSGVLNTSNVIEGANLYFSNTRARNALSGGTGVTYNPTTGSIEIGQSVGTTSDVTFANVTVTGNLLVQGNAIEFSTNTLIINDPLIQLGKNPTGDVVDLGFFGHYIGGSPSVERHAGLFRDATDGQFKLFTNLDPEPVNIVDTANASYTAANLVVNFIVGKVTDISNHTTTSLTEGANLYFTNTRAIGALTSGAGISIASNGLITSTVTGGGGGGSGTVTDVFGQTVSVSNAQLACATITSGVLNTANVIEGANLYFTNTRAIYALTAGLNISIAANGRITGTATGTGSTLGSSYLQLMFLS